MARSRHRRRNLARPDAGFTVMEILVVLGLIAMIAVFVLPKLTKSFGKTAVTEVVTALGNISGQVEGICGTKNVPPTTADVANMLSGPPNRYGAATVTTGATCDAAAIKVAFAPQAAGSLPTICINRTTAGSWSYNWSLPGSGWTDNDIPVKTKDGSFACP